MYQSAWQVISSSLFHMLRLRRAAQRGSLRLRVQVALSKVLQTAAGKGEKRDRDEAQRAVEGAEGSTKSATINNSVCFFVLLSALLSYARRDDSTDVGDEDMFTLFLLSVGDVAIDARSRKCTVRLSSDNEQLARTLDNMALASDEWSIEWSDDVAHFAACSGAAGRSVENPLLVAQRSSSSALDDCNAIDRLLRPLWQLHSVGALDAEAKLLLPTSLLSCSICR